MWQGVCQQLGWRIDESIQDASHWKGVYLKAKLRMMQLKDQEAFVTSSLIGHSARVYALYYKDGLLCTGAPCLSFTVSLKQFSHAQMVGAVFISSLTGVTWTASLFSYRLRWPFCQTMGCAHRTVHLWNSDTHLCHGEIRRTEACDRILWQHYCMLGVEYWS